MKFNLAVTALLFCQLSYAEDLTLTRVKIYDSFQPQELQQRLDSKTDLPLNEIINPLNQVDIVIDKIINIGQKIWGVVEKGRPVVNQKYNSASALPLGANDWAQLSEWKYPRSVVYKIVYKNTYGQSIVDFNYRLSFVFGGSVNGKGRYLTGVRVEPASLKVSWGFKFDVDAQVPEVFNMGTSTNPVAAASVVIRWTVGSSVKSITESHQFIVTGLGQINSL